MTKEKQKVLTNISKKIDPNWDNGNNIDIKERSRYLEDKKLHRSLTKVNNKLKILSIIMTILIIGDIAIFTALFMLNG